MQTSEINLYNALIGIKCHRIYNVTEVISNLQINFKRYVYRKVWFHFFYIKLFNIDRNIYLQSRMTEM